MGNLQRLLAKILGVGGIEEILQKARLLHRVGNTINDPEAFSAHRVWFWGRCMKHYQQMYTCAT